MRNILSVQINVGGGVAGYLCGSHSLKDEVKRPEGTSTRSRGQETSCNITTIMHLLVILVLPHPPGDLLKFTTLQKC